MGEKGLNLNGERIAFDRESHTAHSFRALLDVGLLDVAADHVFPINPDIKIVGASSDMIVVDLGGNPGNLKVGDLIDFKMDYMGTLRLLHSPYVEKIMAHEVSEDRHLKACKIASLGN